MKRKNKAGIFDKILAIRKEYELETYSGNKEVLQFQDSFPCVRVQWEFVAIPQMAYQNEYQRGAIHRGRSVVTIEAFVSKKGQLEAYQKKLEEEDFELLSAVDDSILALKDDIDKYLAMAGEQEKEKEEQHRQSVFAPITSIGSGFREMFGLHPAKKEKRSKYAGAEESEAKKMANMDAYICYKIFKQSHGMMTE